MNNEISYQFDILYNNTLSNKAPGLNPYEKTVFLSKAAIEVIKDYFNPKSNKLGEGFDDSPKRHIDFSSLIVETTIRDFSTVRPKILVILNESVLEDGVRKVVIPISYDEYNRIQSKPYKLPLKHQVWRLKGSSNTFIGHKSDAVFTDYKLRYVKIPNPIFVGEITDFLIGPDVSALSNDGVTEVMQVGEYPYWEVNANPHYWVIPDRDIPDELIPEVVQRAVELAKVAWQGDLSGTLTIGARGE